MTSPPSSSALELQEFLKSRQTVHDFDPDPIPAEPIMRALDCALRAPNHGLTNPWRFAILGHKAKSAIAQLNADIVSNKRGTDAGQAKYTRWMAVPGWLLVTSLRDADALRTQENYAACCCAVQNFALALHSENLGCKWTSGAVTRHPDFSRIAGYDESNEQFVGLIWFGRAKKTTALTKRRPLSEVLRLAP